MKSVLIDIFAVFSFCIATSASSLLLRSNEAHIYLPKGTNGNKKGIDVKSTDSAITEKELYVLYWKGRDNFKCPSKNGAFPDPRDCSSFYKCSQGRSSHQRCQRNMLFDVHRRVCLPRWIAVCGDGREGYTKQPRTTPRTGVTGNDQDFKCNALYGTYPHPTQCEKYYICILFKATLTTCPEMELFDAIKNKCLAEREVNCGSRQRPFVLRTTENIVSQSEEISTYVTEIFSTSELIAEESKPTEIPTEESTASEPESSPTLEQRTESTVEDSTASEPESSPTLEQETESIAEESTASEPETSPTFLQRTESTAEESTASIAQTTKQITESIAEESTASIAQTSPEEEMIIEITTKESTTSKPTGPPETDCDEDDVDCIIKETGEVSDWFVCPDAMGSYEHASSNKLFIFCLNWKPSVKRCGQDLVFSKELATCVRP